MKTLNYLKSVHRHVSITLCLLLVTCVVSTASVVGPLIGVGARVSGTGNAFVSPCWTNCTLITIKAGQSVDFTITPFSTTFYDSSQVDWVFAAGYPSAKRALGKDFVTAQFRLPGRFLIQAFIGTSASGYLYVEVEEGLGCINPPSGMVAWWTMDEVTTDTVYDLKGYNNNGLLIDGTAAPGKVANAKYLDGIDDYINVPDHNTLDFTEMNSFSIDAWIKTSVIDGIQVIVDKRSFSPKITGYRFAVIDGHLSMQLADGVPFPLNNLTYTDYSAYTIVTDGKWHHVGVTLDRGMIEMLPGELTPFMSARMAPDPPSAAYLSFYVDGVLIGKWATNRTGSLVNDNDLIIGKHANNSEDYFNGYLDEIEIFNRALNPKEFYDLWAADASGKCKGGLATSLKGLEVNSRGEINSLSEHESLNIVEISPVPTSGQLDIRYLAKDEGFVDVQILDINGKEVFSGKFHASGETNIISLDLSDINDGVYMLSLSNGKEKTLRKFVKTH